jgi:hypothetical protein
MEGRDELSASIGDNRVGEAVVALDVAKKHTRYVGCFYLATWY